MWMKTVCIRTINGTAIQKQAMSSNRVSKEDRSTLTTRNVHLRVVLLLALKQWKDEMSADITNIQKTEEDRNAKPATLITDDSKVVRTVQPMRRWEPSSRTVAAVSQRNGSSSQAVEGGCGTETCQCKTDARIG